MKHLGSAIQTPYFVQWGGWARGAALWGQTAGSGAHWHCAALWTELSEIQASMPTHAKMCTSYYDTPHSDW